jgi:uncharacterized HAD superfamily protein
MSRKRIAIDVDDVLAAHAQGFANFSNERWGTNLTVDDYDEHWSLVWRTEREETERRAQEFLHSNAVSMYQHDEAAPEVLRRMKEHYDLIVLTSRRLFMQTETLAWLGQYFNGVFDEVRFAGIWDDLSHDRHLATKAEAVREVGADYLVDDQLKHCVAVAEAGVEAVLFGNYRWNQADELPPRVTRCGDWAAVEAYFEQQR